VSVLGVAPTVVRALMRHGDEPAHAHDLSSLRVLGSSGEPWNVDPWQWFLDHVGGGRCPIINYSGGTEVSGGILSGNMLTPVNPCAFAGPCPGMDVDVLDENGNSVRNQVGELVVRSPWPGMTRGFWHDRERYLETYWSRWPNIWVHGDWAEIGAAGQRIERAADALMDIDLGPFLDSLAPDGHRGPATLGQLAERRDPGSRERMHEDIAATSAGLGVAAREAAVMAPILRQTIAQAVRQIEAAAAEARAQARRSEER